MISASQSRAKARESLKGKWGKVALISLIFMLVSFILNFLNAIPVIGGLVVLAITTPLSYGLVATFIKLKRNENFTYLNFLSEGFANFGKAWSVTLWTFLKLLPWIILIIVAMLLSVGTTAFLETNSAIDSPDSPIYSVSIIALIVYIVGFIMIIIKGFSYSMNYYLLYDNPTLTGKEIVEKSAIMMKNNKWRFFCLTLSFIGWTLLSAFTLGIGTLWLLPYIQVAIIHFYENLLEKND